MAEAAEHSMTASEPGSLLEGTDRPTTGKGKYRINVIFMLENT